MAIRFTPGIQPPDPLPSDESAGPAWWFAFVGRKLLLKAAVSPSLINAPSLAALGLEPLRIQYLGQLDGQPCYGAELSNTALPPQMVLYGLRELYGAIADDWLDLAGLAFQIMEWDRTHQFCGHCGTPTVAAPTERTKRCPNCGLSQYPRISPAMIVLISRGDEILLGRAPRFRPGMYSLIAGYVEAHESLEACVVREVKEEVGIEVANIRYWGSQPWPYPHTLMVGFTADYAGGDIAIDPHELTDARWFVKHQLPELPSEVSIARKMINWFIGLA